MSDADGQAPELARARALDAAGRHDEAINELATAAQRGDVAATTLLAKRIVVGDRAPRLTRQGIGLLQDAVKAGGAEAAQTLAVLVAAGVAGPADWAAALRLLALAAERGSTAARGELGAIESQLRADAQRAAATGGQPTGPAESIASASPRAFVAGIDLRALLTPPQGTIVHADPQVRRFPDFVAAEVCAWIVARARGRLTRALVYDVVSESDQADDSRTNSFAVFNLLEADLVHLLVQTRMSLACGQPVAHMEASTALHYAAGEQIGDHYDFIDPEQPGYADNIARFGHRVATFLVYLNADYEGGATVFPKLGVRHAGAAGEGLLFVNTLADGTADTRMLHRGEPPTRGEKWVFSQFIRNRPDRLAQ